MEPVAALSFWRLKGPEAHPAACFAGGGAVSRFLYHRHHRRIESESQGNFFWRLSRFAGASYILFRSSASERLPPPEVTKPIVWPAFLVSKTQAVFSIGIKAQERGDPNRQHSHTV